VTGEAQSDAQAPDAFQRQTRRGFELLWLCDLRQKELTGFKFARIAGPLFALSNLAALLLLALSKEQDALVAITIRTLGGLSWLVGGSAGLSLARDLAERDAAEGVEELIAQRGLDPTALPEARFLAGAKRIALLIATPALPLGLICILLSPTLSTFALRVLLCIEMLGYSVVLAAVVAGVARLASALVPTHGRLTFVAALLLPYLAHRLDAAVPSILDLFDAVLEHLLQAALGAR
jgi:hypothetical protein